MKKLDLKILENADLKTAGRIAEMCPSVDETERKSLLRRLKKRCGNADNRQLSVIPDSSDNEEYYEYKLTGAGNMKRKWLKPVRAAVTALVIVGGLAGGFAVVKSMKKDKPPVHAKVDENGIPILTAAYICSDEGDDGGYFREKVSNLNLRNDDYKVEVITYTYDEEGTSLKKLSLDLADGKVPDIVAGAPEVLMPLYRHGYLEDLGKLMDEKEGIKRSEIVPSLLNAITFDGEVPFIPDKIYAETYAVKTEKLGEDITHWNFEQAIDFYNSLTKEEQECFLWDASSRESLSDYFLEGAVLSCIDYREFTFDPEKGLRQALEFLYSLPDDTDEYPFAEIHHSWEGILKHPFVAVSSAYSNEAIGRNGGEDISLVGYPTENGNGVDMRVYNTVSIMDDSDNEDMAWEFINDLYFSGSVHYYEISAVELPLRASAYPELYDLDPILSDSINRGFCDESGGYSGEENVKFRITDKQKQQLRDYIANLDVCAYHDYELENMIKEECAYVVSGERTPDQCIDILNDRVEKYLAENE